MKRARIVVSGLVQGVSFRAWTLRLAQEKRITGWVANRTDGTVEAVVEGSRSAVADFIESCRQGPRSARVQHVDISWEAASGKFKGFQVLY